MQIAAIKLLDFLRFIALSSMFAIVVSIMISCLQGHIASSNDIAVLGLYMISLICDTLLQVNE